MAAQTQDTIPEIKETNLCGIWEVIRISGENGNAIQYPWTSNRFKYNFLPEMLYLCSKDGELTHGSWKLSEKYIRNKRKYSILLDETYEYIITSLERDEMVLSDHRNEYLLTRRL